MPCEWCPRIRRGIDGACPAETLRHAAFCEFAKQDVEGTIDPYQKGYIEYLCGTVVIPPPPPSLLTRAASFASAVVSHVAAGMPTVDEAEYQRRLALCPGCERTCPHCGCNMLVKMRWASQHCGAPEPKW